MRDDRLHTLPIQICLLISLLLCIFVALRRGVGAWYFRKASPDAIQTAMKWDPANAQYYDALGTLTHLYASVGNSNDIVKLYQSATRLSPRDAQFWADLGTSYDWAGRERDAFDAFERARRLFPNSPEINWRLANLCVRDGKIAEGLRALQIVLEGDSTARRRVFALATNASSDRKAILEILPVQAPIFFDYLSFRTERGDIVGAQEVWDRLLQLKLPFDLPDAFPYLDALIQHKEVGQLEKTWSILAERFPSQIRSRVPSSNLVINGSFEFDILNGGLDWRVIPTDGATVSLDSIGAFEGTRALRIKFDGTRNLDYGHVFQFVPVQPKTRYRFSGHMHVMGITTDSGPRFQVLDAYDLSSLFGSTENLVGTSDWSERHAEFTTKDDTHMLLIRLARPASSKLDNQIGGSVWIDSIALSQER
jgi:hypothetical protein